MKTCKNCNLSFDDDKKFCKNCGNILEENNSIINASPLINTTFFLMTIIGWNVLCNFLMLLCRMSIVDYYIGTTIIKCVTVIIVGAAIYFVREKKVRLFLSICFIILNISYVIDHYFSL